SAEGDLGGAQGLAFVVFDKPVGVLLEDVRLLFGDEGRDPDGRLEAARANLSEHAAHVAAEGRARLKPVAHRRLIAVVNLYVFQAGDVLLDEVEVVQDLPRRDARPEAVPGAPAGRRQRRPQRRVV